MQAADPSGRTATVLRAAWQQSRKTQENSILRHRLGATLSAAHCWSLLVIPASTTPARPRSEPVGPAGGATRRRSPRLAMAALALLAIGLLVPGTALAVDTPSPGAVYSDGPSGRYLVDGSWYSRPDPRNRGSHRRLSARHGPHRLGAGDDPERRQRGRLLAAELSRQRQLVPQGLRAAGVAAARVVGAALRVGQLPRVGLAQRPPARSTRRRIPAVRDRGAGSGCDAQRRQPAGR